MSTPILTMTEMARNANATVCVYRGRRVRPERLVAAYRFMLKAEISGKRCRHHIDMLRDLTLPMGSWQYHTLCQYNQAKIAAHLAGMAMRLLDGEHMTFEEFLEAM